MTAIQVFRKGQIVPRRLRKGITRLRKAQHCITFGVNTVYCDGVFYADLSSGDFVSAVIVFRNAGRKRNNGTFQKCGFYVSNLHCVNMGHKGGSAFDFRTQVAP